MRLRPSIQTATRWGMESPAGSPSSPRRAGCPGRCAVAPSLMDGDAESNKRCLVQAWRQGLVDGVEKKGSAESCGKRLKSELILFQTRRGGSDDDLVFLPSSEDSQIGDEAVGARGDGEAYAKGLVQRLRHSFPPLPSLVDQYRKIVTKYHGGEDRLLKLCEVSTTSSLVKERNDELLVEDESQASMEELLAEDDSQATMDEVLVEDDSQAVTNDDLLIDYDSQPLTQSGDMFKSKKLAAPPSAPCAAADNTGAPSDAGTGEVLRSRTPSPGVMQGPPSPSASVGMASSSP